MNIVPASQLINAPDEVVFNIFQYLGKKDIGACACADRKLRGLAKEFWHSSIFLRQRSDTQESLKREFGFRMKLPNVAPQAMYHSLTAAHVSNSTQYSPEGMYEKSQQEGDPLVVIYWLWKAAHSGHRDATFQLALKFDEGPEFIRNKEQAAKWYQRAAALGDPNAMKCVGDILLSGRGIPKDEQKARELYERASHLGNTDAMVAFGMMLLQGIGGDKDEGKAVDLYTKAAEKGNSNAMTQLGAFFEGKGDARKAQELYEKASTLGNAEAKGLLGRLFEKEKNMELAEKYYKEAALLGNAYSLNWIGQFLERVGKVQEAVVLYKKAAALGYAPSMENLARILRQSEKVTDKQEALKLLEKAAGLGSTSAMRKLGNINFNEDPKNQMQAAMWFQRAAVAGANDDRMAATLALLIYEEMAASGDALAMHCLGHFYETGGKDLPQDLKRAAEWYERAAEEGHAPSMVAFGNMLQLGSGIRRSKKRAIEWYERANALDNTDAKAALGQMLTGERAVTLLEEAAKRGHKEATKTLSAMLASGKAAPGDEKRAAALYKEGAKRGDAVSMFQFGAALEKGKGIPRDEERALKWYKRAAKAGNVDAMYATASMLESKDKRLAFKYCQRAAEAGSPKAMNLLGSFYESATGIPQDLAKAKEWYQQAAMKGDLQGMFNLGLVYRYGKGTAKNHQEAFRCFSNTIARDENHAPSLMLLGLMYELGQYVAQDQSKAIEFYERASQLNYAKATYHLASILDTGQGTARALTLYQKAAELGYVEAMLKLGEKYRNGIDVPPDDLKAAEWYQKAAALNDSIGAQEAIALYTRNPSPIAMRNLGIMYENGQGVDIDLRQATVYYHEAARLRDPIALDLLGDVYALQNQDLQKAKEYYQDAATLGNQASMVKLAALLEKEQAPDEKRIAELYQGAADSGNVHAMKKLAVLHRQGRGCAKDPLKAALLYKKAASNGDLEAKFKLAFLLERGTVLVKDLRQAAELYEEAALAGNTTAMLCLAILYEDGRGVPKDAFRAAMWYQRAAKAGNYSAMVQFGFMCETGDGVSKDEVKALKWYQRAIDGNNDQDALVYFAIMVAEGRGGLDGNETRAVGLLEKAVEKGNARAKSYLAILLMEGRGIQKNERRAWELYQEAISLGDETATERLKPLIEKRAIVPWKPSEQGIINQIYDYACSLERKAKKLKDSEELEDSKKLEDSEEAAKLFAEAGEQFARAACMGDVSSLKKMALIYEEGRRDFDQDIPRAIRYWRRAANAGDPESLLKLGDIYTEGKGVTKNPKEAMRLYQEAFPLVVVLESKDYNQKLAAQLYYKMALFGMPEAMVRYVQMVEEGRGVPKDTQLPEEWRQRAQAVAEKKHPASTALKSSSKRIKS